VTTALIVVSRMSLTVGKCNPFEQAVAALIMAEDLTDFPAIPDRSHQGNWRFGLLYHCPGRTAIHARPTLKFVIASMGGA